MRRVGTSHSIARTPSLETFLPLKRHIVVVSYRSYSYIRSNRSATPSTSKDLLLPESFRRLDEERRQRAEHARNRQIEPEQYEARQRRLAKAQQRHADTSLFHPAIDANALRAGVLLKPPKPTFDVLNPRKPRIVMSAKEEETLAFRAQHAFRFSVDPEHRVSNDDIYPSIDARFSPLSYATKELMLITDALVGSLPEDSLNPHGPRNRLGSLFFNTYERAAQLSLGPADSKPVKQPRFNLMQLHHPMLFDQYPISPSNLLPDGTDRRFLPGPAETWPYRLWASGSLMLQPSVPPFWGQSTYRLHLLERPVHLKITGTGSDAKAFVTIRKSIYDLRQLLFTKPRNQTIVPRDLAPLPNLSNGSDGTCPESTAISEELYTLCFLKNTPPLSSTSTRVIAPPADPVFSHTMTPTRHLLFCWSAVTYNAHAIHLDKSFAQQEYGAPDLLVHGPLTAYLTAEYAVRTLSKHAIQQALDDFFIKDMSYKCLQPLYVDQPMTICMKPISRAARGAVADKWKLWVETVTETGEKALAFKAEIGVAMLPKSTDTRPHKPSK